MKKVYALLLTILPLIGFGQFTYTWHTDTVKDGEPGDDIGFEYTLTNASQDSIDITWIFQHDTAMSQDAEGENIWQDYMCEGIFVCWPWQKRSNTFKLGPLQDVDMYHHIQTFNDVDTGTYVSQALIFQADDSANTVQKMTITARVYVEEDPGDPTGIDFTFESDASLSQNAPNPFRGATTIEYALSGGNGMLKFQDLTGKLVKQIPLNQQQGMVTVQGQLDAGIYFYSLWEDGAMIDSKRMQVID